MSMCAAPAETRSVTRASRIGTAGWSIPKRHTAAFPAGGSHLERYAQRFNAVEINSSFYRPHRRTTYARWAASVPADFAFAVKAPREITHDLRLAGADAALDVFLDATAGLGEKRGVLLFQFPPRFAFDPRATGTFLAALRTRYDCHAAFEPRHASWFTAQTEGLLAEFRIARVAADPAVVPSAAEPGGAPDLCYFRLHGSPRVYWSDYGAEQIEHHAERMKQAEAEGRTAWCIFDNTAAGAATENALALQRRVATARTVQSWLHADSRAASRGTSDRRPQ
jgi:uncharacterized protein YecE (DUF72 family)